MIKLLFVFSISLLFFMPAFSNDLNGTVWSMTGQECRDPDLSRSSRRSMEIRGLKAAVMSFESDTVEMLLTNTRGEESNGRVAYRVNGDEITMGNLRIQRQGKRLLVLGKESETLDRCCHVVCLENYASYRERHKSENTWEQKLEETGWNEEWLGEKGQECENLKDKCLRENIFVYVAGEVSE